MMWVQEQRLNMLAGGPGDHLSCPLPHLMKEQLELAAWAACSVVELPTVLEAIRL
jgi:hypothetical protein